jgi:hypothetical protein
LTDRIGVNHPHHASHRRNGRWLFLNLGSRWSNLDSRGRWRFLFFRIRGWFFGRISRYGCRSLLACRLRGSIGRFRSRGLLAVGRFDRSNFSHRFFALDRFLLGCSDGFRVIGLDDIGNLGSRFHFFSDGLFDDGLGLRFRFSTTTNCDSTGATRLLL